MVLKINSSHLSVWRNTEDLQVSTGSSPVVFERISVAEQKMLTLLYRGVADAQLPALAQSTGLSPEAAGSLVSRLSPLLEVTQKTKQSQTPRALDPDFSQAAFTELIRASLDNRSDGRDILQRRLTRVVHIDSLGKTGLTLIRGLAASGVGKIVSHDNRPVRAADLGVDGYERQDVGSSRFLALTQLLKKAPNQTRLANGNRMSSNSLGRLDAAVLVAQQVIDPRRYSAWHNRNVPHLAITFSLDEVLVSPVIMPGNSPCLLCFELAKAQADESWPAIAMQLTHSPLRFDDVASRLFASGLAIRQLLSVLDRSLVEPDLPAFARGYRLNLITQQVTELSWPKLPSCSCASSASAETVTVLDLSN